MNSNAVRLLIFWSKVEPRPGVYDESYSDQVAERVSRYRNNGMRVVLDMHQDLWGPGDTARRLNAPILLGEFGLDATKPGALDHVDAVRERTREAGASWMCWSNDPGPWAPRDERGAWAPLADHLDRQ